MAMMNAVEAAKAGGETFEVYKMGLWDGINSAPGISHAPDDGAYTGGYCEGFYTRMGQEVGMNSKVLEFKMSRPRTDRRKNTTKKVEKYRPKMEVIGDCLNEARRAAQFLSNKDDRENMEGVLDFALDLHDQIAEEQKKRWSGYFKKEQEKVEGKNGKNGKNNKNKKNGGK